MVVENESSRAENVTPLHGARTRERSDHAAREAMHRRRSRGCGAARLIVFAGAMLLVIRGALGDATAGRAAVAGAVLFALLVVVHRRVQRAELRARRQRLLVEECLARLAGSVGPGAGAPLTETATGLEAGDALHRDEAPRAAIAAWARSDLGLDDDVPSLFRLLDTTQSAFGARRLRSLLHRPYVDAAAIATRTAAVRALGDDGARRDALALAFFGWRGAALDRVPRFLQLPRVLPGGALRLVALLASAVTLPSAILCWRIPAFLPVAALGLTLSFGIHFMLRRRLNPLRDSYLELEPLVNVALEVAPIAPADGVLLGELAGVFAEFCAPGATYRLRSVARRIRMLHLHEIGVLYAPIELLTLWDVNVLLALESSFAGSRRHLARLAGALGDLEALVAQATFAAEQPGLVFAQVESAASPRLEITGGEHPLLPHARAVPNDVRLGGDTRLLFVTGSNMAGKSTFLRMVSLDLVLAQIGCPVRATSMQWTPVAVHALVNVRDALADGKSYFFVEVERVLELLRAAAASPFLFAVFDELFRGTNSPERLAAGREIARALVGSGGLFLLATHEQELARLSVEPGVEGMDVVHFGDAIESGRMMFPYRGVPGLARGRNALRLLELAGYPPDLVERARAYAEAHDPEANPRRGSALSGREELEA